MSCSVLPSIGMMLQSRNIFKAFHITALLFPYPILMWLLIEIIYDNCMSCPSSSIINIMWYTVYTWFFFNLLFFIALELKIFLLLCFVHSITSAFMSFYFTSVLQYYTVILDEDFYYYQLLFMFCCKVKVTVTYVASCQFDKIICNVFQ